MDGDGRRIGRVAIGDKNAAVHGCHDVILGTCEWRDTTRGMPCATKDMGLGRAGFRPSCNTRLMKGRVGCLFAARIKCKCRSARTEAHAHMHMHDYVCIAAWCSCMLLAWCCMPASSIVRCAHAGHTCNVGCASTSKKRCARVSARYRGGAQLPATRRPRQHELEDRLQSPAAPRPSERVSRSRRGN